MKRRARVVAIAASVTIVLLAGTAAGYWIQTRRDVTTDSAEAYRLYQVGLENEQKLYHREAAAAYAEALAKDPHFVMATIRLANQLAEKDLTRARALVRSAGRYRDELTPRERLFLRHAELRFAERNEQTKKESAEIVRELRKRFPEDVEGYLRMYDVLRGEGKPEEAVLELEQILRIDPNYAFAYNNLGYHFMSVGDYAKAEGHFKRYRFLAPEQANPHDSLGELYSHVGRWAEAEESLKKALAIKPDFHASTAHLGTVEVGRGNPAAAAALFKRAAEQTDMRSQQVEWTEAAAHAFVDAGDAAAALAALEALDGVAGSVEGDDKRRVMVRIDLIRAGVLARIGRESEAETLGARVKAELLALSPGKAGEKKVTEELATLRALVAHARGDHETVIANLKSRLQSDEKYPGAIYYYPSRYRLRVMLASALAALGRVDEARETLAWFSRHNPNFAPAQAFLASLARVEPAAPVASPNGGKTPKRAAENGRS